MQHLRWAGLLVLLLTVVFPAVGADEKKSDPNKSDKSDVKKDDKKKDDKKAADPKKKDDVVLVGQYYGQILRIDNNLRIFLKVQERVGPKNTIRNRDVNFEIGENMVVRVEKPPLAFDDKGRPKNYTKEEVDELKGPDKKLWGYTADAEALKQGIFVTVVLARKRSQPRTEPPFISLIKIAGNGQP